MSCNNLFTIARKDLLISFTTAAFKFCYNKESFVSIFCQYLEAYLEPSRTSTTEPFYESSSFASFQLGSKYISY